MQRSPQAQVAILGGAFDPVHLDHIKLAKQCLHLGLAQQLWFVPSPARWDKQPIATVQHRLAMLKIAMAKYGGMQLCCDELEMENFRGTFVLLQKLQDSYCINPILVVGADAYATIPDWRDPLQWTGNNTNGIQLLKKFGLIVFARAGFTMPDAERHMALYGQNIFLISAVDLDNNPGQISSREIRQRCERGLPFEHLVPDGVGQYIVENGLYGAVKFP